MNKSKDINKICKCNNKYKKITITRYNKNKYLITLWEIL